MLLLCCCLICFFISVVVVVVVVVVVQLRCYISLRISEAVTFFYNHSHFSLYIMYS